MRIIAAISLPLLATASFAAPPSAAPPALGGDRPARGGEIRPDTPAADTMNVYTQAAHCTPIERQVSGEDRRYPGTRLDQEPAGRLILAVDRSVNGCHEAVLASDQRFGRPALAEIQRQPVLRRLRSTRVGQSPRSIAPASAMPWRR